MHIGRAIRRLNIKPDSSGFGTLFVTAVLTVPAAAQGRLSNSRCELKKNNSIELAPNVERQFLFALSERKS
jgi:hypothetical protein